MTTRHVPRQTVLADQATHPLPAWAIAGDGLIRVRLQRPGDRGALIALHERCSAETLRLRYLQPVRNLDALVDWTLDPARGHGIVAMIEEQIVAVALVMRTAVPGQAELAFLVEDAHQGAGIGATLVDLATSLARVEGFTDAHADVALDNDRMMHLLRSRGWQVDAAGGVYGADLPLGSAGLT